MCLLSYIRTIRAMLPSMRRLGGGKIVNCKNMMSADLSACLPEEAKIALVPGDVFGPGGEGYLRMSSANSCENVVGDCEQLRRAVKEL